MTDARDFEICNANLVLEDRVVAGGVVVRDGRIAEVTEGSARSGLDLEGDYLIPGLVELHTDHLEVHYAPRPGVRWDTIAAIQAHDGQVATAGITTVFDCLRMGSDEDGGFAPGEMRALADALHEGREQGRFRADHLIHLRCEVSAPDMLADYEAFRDDPLVHLASVMDHAPGQRQFQTMDQYTLYYKTKRGLSDAAFAAFIARRQEASARHSGPNRQAVAADCRARGIALASHDDATIDHVAESAGHGVRIAEFPTTLDAARASHAAGIAVLMGAPNIVRGRSHSGNIAAGDLAAAGVLDVLSSDYVPISLIHAPFILADRVAGIDLPQAIAMVTATPARSVGLADRGRLAEGLRADLVRVHRDAGVPVVRAVWREGRRVA
ncbi:alpha-D-ribose 1-methylphosphonate 5-triphosphate diphosphatase [Pleomorphomonas carboxyditropha]|uniref:Phosphonate metabolism protein PhnM n=1 Tax=Pleomorphomonas carboxyditropha TaxID=2023338 RepID=A0A2G9X2Y8_9HYPH|nr:alpha-D-ribose 1-methylphosphonate 5-triphosphate diphosphatase [Pleomorphomonas carboxyditropha]PIP01295.1 phosphonate metabolism protein PhnM [Pleomorphomonas carboxyditropha]